jgi:tRNA (guanine-N7-)-methyltransferase
VPRKKTRYREALGTLDRYLRAPDNPVVVPEGMPATVEVGMGAGHVLVGRARAEPGRYFVGLEIKEERAYQAGRAAAQLSLPNLALLVGEISRTESALPRGRFDELLILFPDPWPRRRDVAKRLVSPRYLGIFSRWMAPGAAGLIRSDDPAVLDFALGALSAAGCELTSICEDAPAEAVLTRYESRFRESARRIGEVRFRFSSRETQ